MLKDTFTKFQRIIPYANFVFFAILVNIFVIIFVFLVSKNLPPEVPIYYGRAVGEGQLAEKSFLILPPGISIALAIINTSLMKILKDDFLQKVLLGTLYAASLLSTITVVKIVFLVGSF